MRRCPAPEIARGDLGGCWRTITLVVFALLPWTSALQAIGKGTDVYLFLIGMMLLAELARREGLFDWLAALAARQARGSPRRLFGFVYAVGTVVTVFLSNDATAVVLTPAVYAAARAAKAEPLPYLFICAFIANGMWLPKTTKLAGFEIGSTKLAGARQVREKDILGDFLLQEFALG